jgi:UDPglucose--hexose-1-phosphate uridylyltransferase
MQGYGHHEVIIESPRHDHDIATMEDEDVAAVLMMYKQRYVEHRQDPRNLLILIFRNHGQRAGASLIHPHSQIITTGMIPRHVRTREDEAQRYYDEWGQCVYCDMIAFEQMDRQRVVLENDSFIAFVPYAAEVPFETWIVPKRHQTDFAHISENECVDLTFALRSVLGRLRSKLNDPDYNYVLNTTTRVTNEPQLHWYVRVRPRLVTRAGFEIGSGMRINPSLPEADAAFLNAPDDHGS